MQLWLRWSWSACLKSRICRFDSHRLHQLNYTITHGKLDKMTEYEQGIDLKKVIITAIEGGVVIGALPVRAMYMYEPQVGQSFVFVRTDKNSDSSHDVVRTSKVASIEEVSPTVIKIHTKNSVYLVKSIQE